MHVPGKYYYLHFTDENTEAQKGQMTCPRSHSKVITETGLGSPDSPFSVLHLHYRAVSESRYKVDPGPSRKDMGRSQL